MVNKTCPHCGKNSYSAATTGEWICPYCGKNLDDVPAENVNYKKEKNIKLPGSLYPCSECKHLFCVKCIYAIKATCRKYILGNCGGYNALCKNYKEADKKPDVEEVYKLFKDKQKEIEAEGERIEALQQENQQLRTRIRELEGELKEQRLAEKMNSNEGIEKVKDLIAKLDKYMEQKKPNKESSDKDA